MANGNGTRPLNMVRDFAQTFTAVAAALAICGVVAWTWLTPKIEGMIADSEQRQNQRLALFATAVATQDTVLLRVIALHGIPAGPAGIVMRRDR